METQTTAVTKFTTSKLKVKQLFMLDKITRKDIEGLEPSETKYFSQFCAKMLGRLEGEERENFLEKIDHVLLPVTKSDIWEYNHATINNAVSDFMRRNGTMPTQNTIADETGLSRPTIAKHFAAYKQHPDFIAQMEQYKFMAPNLLANVYKVALGGDTKAARLYLETIGSVNKKPGSTMVNEQNNYIQINNTILSQENLKQLTEAQLNQIESIITNIG